MTKVIRKRTFNGLIVVIGVLTIISIGFFFLWLGEGLQQTNRTQQQRIQLSNLRTAITQTALTQQCEAMNKKFAKLIPLETAGLKQLRSGKIAYYRTHPGEKAFEIHQINLAIRALEPDKCDINLIGRHPHANQG